MMEKIVSPIIAEIKLIIGIAEDKDIKDITITTLGKSGFLRKGGNIELREENGKLIIDVKPTIKYTKLGIWYRFFQLRSFLKNLPLIGYIFRLFL